jgi:hypothetical protein
VSSPTIVAALADALRSAPGRPLITLYDSAGERVELSVATFDNWVCKLANLFSGDWQLEPGDLVSVQLPAHWRGAVITLGAWTAGLTVTFQSTPGAATSVLRWDDFAAEVSGQPDELVLPSRVTGPSVALVDASGASTHADLVGRGLAAADTVGLGRGGRLLTNLNPASEAGVDIALLAPLVTGASVVLNLDPTPERRERIAAQERVTCTHWA